MSFDLCLTHARKGAISAAALAAEGYFDRIRVFERKSAPGGTWYVTTRTLHNSEEFSLMEHFYSGYTTQIRVQSKDCILVRCHQQQIHL